MGLFDKLFAKDKPDSAHSQDTAVVETPPCLHGILVPQWDNAADMGHEERATHFVCQSCHESFSPEEAARLRTSMAERLVGHEVDSD